MKRNDSGKTFMASKLSWPQRSHECALKLTDLWIKSLFIDLNNKLINWSFAFSPGGWGGTVANIIEHGLLRTL